MKTVIEMAREAGFVLTKSEWVYVDMLERFAELVAAAEREACAKIVDTYCIANQESDIMVNAFDHCAATIRASSNT